MKAAAKALPDGAVRLLEPVFRDERRKPFGMPDLFNRPLILVAGAASAATAKGRAPQVADQPKRLLGLLEFSKRLVLFLDLFGPVGWDVGDLGQRLQQRGNFGLDLLAKAIRPQFNLVGERTERGHAPADNAIAVPQMMVQERQRLVAGDRFQPQREFGEFHRQAIQIDAIQTALNDAPLPVADGRLIAAQRGAARIAGVRMRGDFLGQLLALHFLKKPFADRFWYL